VRCVSKPIFLCLVFCLVGNTCLASNHIERQLRPAGSVTIYASQSGAKTYDALGDGGNPFASALVELLSRPELRLGELVGQISRLTQQKSHRLQLPQVSGLVSNKDWPIKPSQAQVTHVALVATFSRYRAGSVRDLPGAEFDRHRVAGALQAAGFQVVSIANPSTAEFRQQLNALASASTKAQVALIYVTGHGFEHQGKVYLAASEYRLDQAGKPDPDRKPFGEGAIAVGALARDLQATQANLVFFGGCRTLVP
jgi:hypothetical protein